MDIQKIQTLHPNPLKINKVISTNKYEIVRDAMLKILDLKPLTHTALMEAIHNNVKNILDGNAQWYGETVKLDLEARGLVVRDNSKLPIYKLK